MLWVVRGNAAGLVIFLVLVAAVYALVPLETAEAVDAVTSERTDR
jgi:hypothetical protein